MGTGRCGRWQPVQRGDGRAGRAEDAQPLHQSRRQPPVLGRRASGRGDQPAGPDPSSEHRRHRSGGSGPQTALGAGQPAGQRAHLAGARQNVHRRHRRRVGGGEGGRALLDRRASVPQGRCSRAHRTAGQFHPLLCKKGRPPGGLCAALLRLQPGRGGGPAGPGRAHRVRDPERQRLLVVRIRRAAQHHRRRPGHRL